MRIEGRASKTIVVVKIFAPNRSTYDKIKGRFWEENPKIPELIYFFSYVQDFDKACWEIEVHK